MLPGEAIHRAPSLHRGGRYQAHRPRLERGDAPARGTRRGSSEGMAPCVISRAGPQVKLTRSCLSRTVACHRTRRQNSSWMETSLAGERGGGSFFFHFLSGTWSGRGIGRRKPSPTRTEAGASRGGGFTARGRARASNIALQRSVGSRKPTEARLKTSSSRVKSERRALRDAVNPFRAAGGQAGAGSRVTLLDTLRKVRAPALSTTTRLSVEPLRGRSRGCIHVARRGSGSTWRSVARASYRRKAHRIAPSLYPFTGAG